MRRKSAPNEHDTNDQRHSEGCHGNGMNFVPSSLWMIFQTPLELVSFIDAERQISDFQDLQDKDRRIKAVC